jgi:hypothetical protein
VVQQDPTHGLRRDPGHHVVAHQLPSNLGANSLGQRPPKLIGPSASNHHHVHRNFGGKRPACGRVRGECGVLGGGFSRIEWSTCACASQSCSPTDPRPPTRDRRRRLESHAPVEPYPKESLPA